MACAECRMREQSVALLRERCMALEDETYRLRRAGKLIALAERETKAERARADRLARQLKAARNALHVQVRHAKRLMEVLQDTAAHKKSAAEMDRERDARRAYRRNYMREWRRKYPEKQAEMVRRQKAKRRAAVDAGQVQEAA